jgi:hypothetical protein
MNHEHCSRPNQDDLRATITLFCPHCDYNLTGLPENRCPECGHRFDPVELLAEASANPKPISLRTALIHLLWPVVICLLATLPDSGTFFTISLILFPLTYGILNSELIAERIVAGYTLRRGVGFSRMRYWRRIVALWLALYAAQLALTAILLSGYWSLAR